MNRLARVAEEWTSSKGGRTLGETYSLLVQASPDGDGIRMGMMDGPCVEVYGAAKLGG
jgi:hypothetical protein